MCVCVCGGGGSEMINLNWIISLYIFQITMSVKLIMGTVSKTATTPSVATSALVILDMNWIVMERHALVRIVICCEVVLSE